MLTDDSRCCHAKMYRNISTCTTTWVQRCKFICFLFNSTLLPHFSILPIDSLHFFSGSPPLTCPPSLVVPYSILHKMYCSWVCAYRTWQQSCGDHCWVGFSSMTQFPHWPWTMSLGMIQQMHQNMCWHERMAAVQLTGGNEMGWRWGWATFRLLTNSMQSPDELQWYLPSINDAGRWQDRYNY